MTEDIAIITPEIDERIERLIWKSLGVKSARQIATETGLTPEEVLRIKHTLLESVDVLTVQERRQRLVIELEKLAQDARDRAENSSDEFFAGMLNAARGAMKDILTELNRVQKGEYQEITHLNQLRRDEIVRMYVRVVDSSVAEISRSHGISEDELFQVFNDNLTAYAREQDGL